MSTDEIQADLRQRIALYSIVGVGLTVGYGVLRGSTWIGSA